MLEHFNAPHLLTGHAPDTPILVALSGGADSVALLDMLRQYAAEYGTPLRVAHVNHGIRGEEALRDRNFCVALAAQWELPISVLDADVPAIRTERGGSMEEVARQVRYDFFTRVMEEYHIPLLATAHHADDQLETILLRLVRGTGPDGLCGIPSIRAMGKGRLVVRPLLGFRKAELESYCHERGLAFMVDSTNEDISYARNRVRQRIIPELRAINPAVTEAAARLSETMRVDVGYLTELTDAFVREAVTLSPQANGSIRVSVPCERLIGLENSVRRRVLMRMMQYAGCPQAEERFVARLCDMVQVRNGRWSLSGGVSAVCYDNCLYLCRENGTPETRQTQVDLDLSALPHIVHFGEFCVTFSDTPFDGSKKTDISENVYKMSMNIPLDFDTIKRTPVLRVRSEGDRFLWHGCHRKVKKLFCDRKVPPMIRDQLPLLCDREGIVWIPGIGVRDGAMAQAGSRILYVSISHIDP